MTGFDPRKSLSDQRARAFWNKVLDDPDFMAVLTAAHSTAVSSLASPTPQHVEGATAMANSLLNILESEPSREPLDYRHSLD